MFNSFLSDDRKQDSSTTNAHIKRIIEFLKQRNIVLNKLSTIWENIYGCAEHYICATALYLMSIFSLEFYVIIDRGISAPGYGREVVYGLNTTDKRFIFQLMYQLEMTYIGRRKVTVEQWVELRPIFELCAGEKCYKVGGFRRDEWWRQQAAEKQLKENLEEILR